MFGILSRSDLRKDSKMEVKWQKRGEMNRQIRLCPRKMSAVCSEATFESEHLSGRQLVVPDAHVSFRYQETMIQSCRVFVSWENARALVGVVPMNLIDESMDLDLSFDWYSRMICLHQHANYERWCRRLSEGKWRNVSIDNPPKNGKHRRSCQNVTSTVWLQLDETGRLHRSVDRTRAASGW